MSLTNNLAKLAEDANKILNVVDGNNVVISNSQLSTSANDGFLYIPTCNGTPTGTPTSYTGTVAIVMDVANNKLYFYSNNSWNSVVSDNVISWGT